MNIRIVLSSAIIVVILLNSFLTLKYDTNLIEWVFEDDELTKSEKAYLEKHGNIIYSSDHNSPPLRYVDENGQYQGVIVDYMSALSIQLGTKIEFKPEAAWKDAYQNVESVNADYIDMISSPNRNLNFHFSKPIYMLRGTLAYIKGKQKITNIHDLTNKTIAVQRSDYANEFLKNKAVKANIIQTDNISEALTLLENGEADAVIGDEPVIKNIAARLSMENHISYVEKPLYEEDVVLAVAKSQKELLPILNKGILELEKRNTMKSIEEKWFGAYSISTTEKQDKGSFIYLSSILIIALLFYIFYTWNLQLKNEVKKRTKELNLSRNNLIQTFDGFTDYLAVIDKFGKVFLVNQSLCDKVGKTRDSILGGDVNGCFDFPCWDYAKELVRDTFENGNSMAKEYKCNSIIFSINTFPIREGSDEIERVLAVMKDITNLKVSEKLLLHEDKMAGIGELAAAVAHEIRNPLGIIRNNAYIIKKNPDSDDRTQKSIAAIENSVDRASGIIDNLLNFSRLSPNTVLNTNLEALINSIFILYTKPMQEKKIQYRINCDGDSECELYQESLKHIIRNLISNSIDAIDQNGMIEANCIISAEQVVIEISDTGAGIREEDVESVFTPFFTTKAPGKGTGLGLYIVYNEVKKCSGEISVFSIVEKGTTFRISLPLPA